MILPTYFRASSHAHPIDDTPSGLMAELLERVMSTPVRPYRADMEEAERRVTVRPSRLIAERSRTRKSGSSPWSFDVVLTMPLDTARGGPNEKGRHPVKDGGLG